LNDIDFSEKKPTRRVITLYIFYIKHEVSKLCVVVSPVMHAHHRNPVCVRVRDILLPCDRIDPIFCI